MNLFKSLQISIISNGILIKPLDSNTISTSTTTNNSILCQWNGEVKLVSNLIEEGVCKIIVLGQAGILKGFQNSFLILVTSTSVVDTFESFNQIHCIKTTLFLPLDPSFAKATLLSYIKTLPTSTSEANVKESEGEEETSSSDEEEEEPEADESITSLPSQLESEKELATTIRLAHKPSFWKRIPFTGLAPSLSLTNSKSTPISIVEEITAFPSLPESVVPTTTTAIPPTEEEEDLEVIASRKLLDKKVVKECQNELKGLYFSFSNDITHSLQHKYELFGKTGNGLVEPLTHLPLHQRADKRFWWNSHLSSNFVEIGAHSFILVLQQGFVQQVSVSLPLESYNTSSLSTEVKESESTIALDLLIISRRSIERPGFRYQRRGIDNAGAVANFVETEFLVRAIRDGVNHISSFVQTRGSIPLFWSQSPWNLKPIPVVDIEREKESLAAMSLHFSKQIKIYGKQIIVNLAETKGKEGAVVEAYRKGVEFIGKEDMVKYVEFDFHEECKGMRYQNISKLTDALRDDIDELSYFWTGEQVLSTQSGVIRTNCIDCLDRTNVIQTALSRSILNRHLVHLGITTQEEVGLHDNLDIAFNGIWASNGDAISRLYSGTNALKGDFTRTGKRNIYGLVNDASNSVARLLQSTTSDFFKQATVDYVLGVNTGAFSEFQDRLDLSDPSEIIRLSQIREEAIENSTRLVLLPGEEKLFGYTLLAPLEPDVVRSTKFVEKILLISNKAVYIVNYDFNLQKVTGFTRIPTGDIVKLQQGPYILSASDSGRDPLEHYGFLIKFHPHDTTEKVHTFSMRVKVNPTTTSPTRKLISPLELNGSPSSINSQNSGSIEFDTKYFAFKALRKDIIQLSTTTDGKSQIIKKGVQEKGKTAKAVVGDIIKVLGEECEKAGAVDKEDKDWVEDKAIISLSEAIAHTSYSDKLYSLSKSLQSLIWL